MGHYSYLCVLDEPVICPTEALAGFHDDASSIIAFGKYSVPALWPLLFGPDDLNEGRVQAIQGVDDPELGPKRWAPLCPIDEALSSLHHNASKVRELFDAPIFDGYVTLLCEELQSRKASYVTIDLGDLEDMGEEKWLLPLFKRLYDALAATSKPLRRPQGLWQRLTTHKPAALTLLCELSGLRPSKGLGDARCLIGNENLTKAHLENHWAMLGSNYGGPTAWDPCSRAPHGTAEEVIAARTSKPFPPSS